MGEFAEPARISDFRVRAAARERAAWGGGEPLTHLNDLGIQPLAWFDRELVDAIIAADPEQQRRIARWVTRRVFGWAGLAERDWVIPALRALDDGAPPPPPFESQDDALARLRADSSGTVDWPYETTVVRPQAERSPFDLGKIDRPRHAIPAFFSALDPDPLRAALGALMHASVTFGSSAAALHSDLRQECGIA